MENQLSKLSFSEFSNLIGFLRSLAEERQKQNKLVSSSNEVNEFIFKNIQKFFPEISAVQALSLNHIVETMDEEEFNEFKKENPNIYIDPTGKSKPKERKYWEITLETLKKLYEFSLNSKTPVGVQVIDALDLNCLLNNRYYGYVAARKIFLEKFQSISPELFLSIENFFKEYFGNTEASIILGQVVGYSLSEKSKFKFEIFIEHFIRRAECLLLEFNTEKSITNEENLKFVKNIERIIKQYFINEKE